MKKLVSIVAILCLISSIGFTEVTKVSDTEIRITKEEVIEVSKLLQYKKQLEHSLANNTRVAEQAAKNLPIIQADLDKINTLIKDASDLGLDVTDKTIFPVTETIAR